MKNQNNNLAFTKEYKLNKKETVNTMEAVCFTDISERMVTSLSPLRHAEFLGLIAVEHKLNFDITPFGFLGDMSEVEKAQNILVESVKYN